MEETTYVFWVDLGYKLRGRDMVLLHGSRGWLTSHTVTVVPGGMAWFSARCLRPWSRVCTGPT